MELIDKPIAQLLVNHRDATGYFDPWLIEIAYQDHLEGESDGLEVKLDNSEGRWMNQWYPVKGTSIEAALGYEGRPLLSTGVCQVDEIELDGPPDVVTIRALGAGNMTALRTSKSRAFEGKSLRSIAYEVASYHSLTLVGEVPDVRWSRATQHRETDLGFLNRIGAEHGIVFSVKGDKLVFHDLFALEKLPKVLSLTPADMTSYRFREKVVVSATEASYFDGTTKELRSTTATMPENPHPDRHKVRRRTESKAHTQRLAQAAMHVKKSWERDATLTLPGNPQLVAGCNLELTKFGVLDGLWLIRAARHSITRGEGYRTELEVRHVAS
jgi:hypothetical protein